MGATSLGEEGSSSSTKVQGIPGYYVLCDDMIEWDPDVLDLRGQNRKIGTLLRVEPIRL